MKDPEHVKIQVVLENIEHVQSETLWAFPTDKPDHYEVDNIPYYAYGINAHDIVRCSSPPERQVLEVVRPSGHKTLRVRFQPDAPPGTVNEVVKELVKRGGHPDLGLYGFLSLDVGKNAAYQKILTYLEEKQKERALVYESAEQQVKGSFSPKPG